MLFVTYFYFTFWKIGLGGTVKQTNKKNCGVSLFLIVKFVGGVQILDFQK